MSKQHSHYNVQGFLNNKREQQVQSRKALFLKEEFRGKQLNELQLQGTITSRKELNDFMRFLNEVRPCFVETNE